MFVLFFPAAEHPRSVLTPPSPTPVGPQHISVWKTEKGLASHKGKPCRHPGNPFPARLLWPRSCPGGSQLVTGVFGHNHQLGELETELAFPVGHCRERGRTAQGQQVEKEAQNSLCWALPGCGALIFLLLHMPGWEKPFLETSP